MESSGTRRVQSCPGEEYCSYVSSDMTDEDYYYGLEIETSEFSSMNVSF